MTRPDLDALRVLLELAAPRPWRGGDGWVSDANDEPVAKTDVESIHSTDTCKSNDALIIAAVNAMPGLLYRIAELESEREVNHRRLQSNDVRIEMLAFEVEHYRKELRSIAAQLAVLAGR